MGFGVEGQDWVGLEEEGEVWKKEGAGIGPTDSRMLGPSRIREQAIVDERKVC